MKSRSYWLIWLAFVLVLAGCVSSPEGPAAKDTPPPAATRPTGSAAEHLAAGEAALNRNDLAAAEQAFRNALALDPKSAQAHFGLGNVLVRQGRLVPAEESYKAALALDPNLAVAHANLGVVYYQMGDLKKAAQSYEAALRIKPDDAETLYLLAGVRLQENDLAAAEPLLLKARDLKPDLPEVYYGLGALYKLKGQKAEAIAAFEKFLAIGPGQDPAAMNYARQELEGLKK